MYLTGLVLSKVVREIGKISFAPTLTELLLILKTKKINVSPCITSKVAYQKLLKQLVKPPTAQKSLERMLGLENVDWSRIYLLPRATTIESSLRSFQYKILNNTLYLNERLFKLNAVESPQCSLCKQFPESVLHLFCTCSVTRSLWAQFCLWGSNATSD